MFGCADHSIYRSKAPPLADKKITALLGMTNGRLEDAPLKELTQYRYKHALLYLMK